jgi:hypothetical protein
VLKMACMEERYDELNWVIRDLGGGEVRFKVACWT